MQGGTSSVVCLSKSKIKDNLLLYVFFDLRGITKGVESKDAKHCNPVPGFQDIEIYYLGTLYENANDSC